MEKYNFIYCVFIYIVVSVDGTRLRIKEDSNLTKTWSTADASDGHTNLTKIDTVLLRTKRTPTFIVLKTWAEFSPQYRVYEHGIDPLQGITFEKMGLPTFYQPTRGPRINIRSSLMGLTTACIDDDDDYCVWKQMAGWTRQYVDKPIPSAPEAWTLAFFYLACQSRMNHKKKYPEYCMGSCKDPNICGRRGLNCKPLSHDQIYKGYYDCECQKTFKWDASQKKCIRSAKTCDDAEEYPCDRVGTEKCVLTDDDIPYRCSCRPQMMGVDCDQQRDPCEDPYEQGIPPGNRVCLPHGKCSANPGDLMYKCDCDEEYTDGKDNNYPDCNQFNHCAPLECKEGHCKRLEDFGWCICNEGFEGMECSMKTLAFPDIPLEGENFIDDANAETKEESGNKVSTGTIVGISIGSIVGVLVILVIVMKLVIPNAADEAAAEKALEEEARKKTPIPMEEVPLVTGEDYHEDYYDGGEPADYAEHHVHYQEGNEVNDYQEEGDEPEYPLEEGHPDPHYGV